MRRAVLVAAAVAAGAVHALSFAPFERPWLQLLALAVLFALTTRAGGWRFAALLGFAFGLGWFGVGVSWVYISMHVYGLMPAPLAAAATLAFCAFLSLYPALALGAAQRIAPVGAVRVAVLLPALWALSEWLRGSLFTGFPWIATGYAHTDGPLAGFAPVAGVYGVTLAAALVAGALALLAVPLRERRLWGYLWIAGILIAAVAAGSVLGAREWTQPAGAPIAVRLVQANIPQDSKFGPEGLRRAFEEHWALMQGERVDLVALPESVFPVPLQFVPVAYLQEFKDYAQRNDTAVVFGVFLEQPADAFYNSAIGIAPGGGAAQRYSKRHLVPFGEFIPPGFRWFVDLMRMPIGDQQRGDPVQPPMELAGQRIAVNICYEDLFGHVIAAAWQGKAPPTIMLNMSNLAWFANSLALPQHLQISRMRALETQHPMLRATNTGATAIIDARGRVTASLPFLQPGALAGQVQGVEGLTPFLRWGNGPAIVAALVLAVLGALLARRRYPTSAKVGT